MRYVLGRNPRCADQSGASLLRARGLRNPETIFGEQLVDPESRFSTEAVLRALRQRTVCGYVEQLAHLGGGTAGFEPDLQRLGQPLAPVGADLRDGREFARGEPVDEDRVGEEPPRPTGTWGV